MQFRLEFEGVDRGVYPSGLKFSPAEITSTPVLLKVYEQNRLSDLMSFETFSRSIFVLESNRQLERLMAEYQGRLSDPKLTPIDRERIEKEFDLKRNSVSKSDYAISIADVRGVKQVPTSIRKKVLSDALAEWARQAAVEKRALDYRIPVLTTNLLQRTPLEQNDYAVGLIMLRNRAIQILQNIGQLSSMPGAELVRTRERITTLAEIGLELEDTIRFRIDPLLLTVYSRGLVRDRAALVDTLKAQVAYDRRRLNSSRMKETALQNALSTYEKERRPVVDLDAANRVAGSRSQGVSQPAGETIMPQISESFIDRVLALASSSADRDYRQRLVNKITEASLDVIPAEASLNYHLQLLDQFENGAGRSEPGAAEQVRLRLAETFTLVERALNEVHEIYTAASAQLNPATELFSVLSPPATRVERSVAPERLVLFGVLLTLLSLPVIIAVAMIHSRIREESRREREVYLTSPAAAQQS